MLVVLTTLTLVGQSVRSVPLVLCISVFIAELTAPRHCADVTANVLSVYAVHCSTISYGALYTSLTPCCSGCSVRSSAAESVRSTAGSRSRRTASRIDLTQIGVMTPIRACYSCKLAGQPWLPAALPHISPMKLDLFQIWPAI